MSRGLDSRGSVRTGPPAGTSAPSDSPLNPSPLAHVALVQQLNAVSPPLRGAKGRFPLHPLDFSLPLACSVREGCIVLAER
jgi:hypothetical protein